MGRASERASDRVPHFSKPENGTLAAPAAAAVVVISADGETFGGGHGGGRREQMMPSTPPPLSPLSPLPPPPPRQFRIAALAIRRNCFRRPESLCGRRGRKREREGELPRHLKVWFEASEEGLSLLVGRYVASCKCSRFQSEQLKGTKYI